MSDDEREDRDMDLLKKYVAQLSEHFDTVQVFATRVEGKSTMSCHYGGGNWFARYGQIRTWMAKEDQEVRNMAPKDEDG